MVEHSTVSRRTVLSGVASASIVGVAGCLGSAKDSNNDGKSDFRTSLEADGVDVYALDMMAGDHNLIYNKPAEGKQIATVALVYSDGGYYTNSERMLSVNIREKESGDRYGTWYARRDWAGQYASGDLSRSDYVSKCQNTFERK